MKKKILFLGGALCLIGIATSSLHSNSSGAPAGRSGAPGDFGQTCVGCHSGVPATDQVGSFQVFLNGQVATSYTDGETYDVSYTIDPGMSNYPRMGFQATVEDANNQKVGTLIVSDNSNTKFASFTQEHITHTSAGIVTSTGPKTWNFQWQAPTGTVEDVTFYAAGLCANGNGNDNGDIVVPTAAYTLSKEVNSVEDWSDAIRIFPNPAQFEIQVESGRTWDRVELINTNGQVVETWQGGLGESGTLSLPKLSNGNYLLQLSGSNGIARKNLLISQN